MPGSVKAFIQARMSSLRFPGKVLAPFRGEPLIRHVIRTLQTVLSSGNIVVATSSEASDDPLAAYLRANGYSVSRGPLDNVFERFRKCLAEHPCDWILRISADSPFLDPRLVCRVIECGQAEECDLVTTIFPRTFPRGQNAELIRTTAFLSVEPNVLTMDDQEHVTTIFYRNAGLYRIINIDSGRKAPAGSSLAVDTLEDLRRIEALSDSELGQYWFGEEPSWVAR